MRKKPPLCVPENHKATHTNKQTRSLKPGTQAFDFKVSRLALSLIVVKKAEFKGLCACVCVCSQEDSTVTDSQRLHGEMAISA